MISRSLLLFPAVFLSIYCCASCFAESEIELWHQWAGGKREILRSMLKDYSRREGVAVRERIFGPAGGAVVEALLLAAPAERPHLAIVERDAAPLLAEKGFIHPLDNLLEESNLLHKRNWRSSARNYVSYRGQLFGIPAYLNPYVLMYNPELLARVGGKPPSRWSEFLTLHEGLSSNAPVSEKIWVLNTRSMDALFTVLSLQKDVDDVGRIETVEKEGDLRKTLEYMKELRDREVFPPYYKFWDPQFFDIEDGNVLFQLEDAAYLAAIKDSAPVPLAVAMMPTDSGNSQTALSDSPVLVLCRADLQEETLDFLRFFFSSPQYRKLEEKFFFISPLKREDEDIEKMLPLYLQVLQSAENAASVSLSSPNSGVELSKAARAVARMDAGLLSVEQAVHEIMSESRAKVTGEIREGFPSGAARSCRSEETTCAGDDQEDDLTESAGRLTVSWAESTKRIFADQNDFLRAGPVVIACARNEHEAFQLLISGNETTKGISCRMSTFTNAAGASVNLPVSVYEQTDSVITTPLVAAEPGPYPNILEPARLIDVRPDGPVRLWVDVFVPEGVPAGDYKSSCALSHDEEVVANIPITLRVLPFSLPQAPSQPAVIGLNYELIARHYQVSPESEEGHKLLDMMYWFMVERRLIPYQPPAPLSSPGAARYLQDERVSACRIPFPPAGRLFAQVVENAEKGGWLEKLFVYFIDEPTYHQYAAVVETGRKIHSRERHPRFLVTCFPEDSLVGAVDIWCIHMPFLPIGIPHIFMDRGEYRDRVKQRLETGDEVWWYTAGAIKPFPTLHIEDDPAAFRIIPWMQQFYGIDGFLHWESANWIQSLDEPFIPFFGNGEGVLVYPGEGGPIPSIRLELLRQGLEDMEYLFLLRQSLERVQKNLGAENLGDIASRRVRELCRRLISCEALAPEDAGVRPLMFYRRDAGAMERVRLAVAEEIIALAESPRVLVLTEPEEKQYTEAEMARIYGVSEPGCAVKVNSQACSADSSGAFSIHLPLHMGMNTFDIVISSGTGEKSITRKIERF